MASLTEIAVGAIATVVSATLATVTTVLVKRRPALISAEAQAQTAVNSGFADLSAALLKRMDDQDRQIKTLLGEVDNLTQHVYSLEKILRDNGLPIPMRQRPSVLTVVPATQ